MTRGPALGHERAEITVEACPTCGSRTPAGSFCGACGSRLGDAAASRDRGAFAADPGEHVARPWLMTTFFPYLPRRSTAPFRLAIVIGALILVFLGLLRLSGPVIVASAVLLPALYLIYLFEVGVYEDQPWFATLATVVVGVLLGLAWAATIGPIATQALVLGAVGRLDVGRLLAGGVLAPLVAQALILVGPAVLFLVGRFRSALDGFTFGVASALGFSLATTLYQLVTIVGEQPISSAEPIAFTLEVVRRGIAGPLVAASLAGLVAAAFWLHREPPGLRPRGAIASRSIAVGAAVIVQVGLGIADVTLVDSRLQFVLWTVAAIVLIVLVRLALHEVLLTEAQQIVIGEELVCSHCHAIVPSMPFCPNCGIARRATPKIGRLDLGKRRPE